jgi:hypothetical protein
MREDRWLHVVPPRSHLVPHCVTGLTDDRFAVRSPPSSGAKVMASRLDAASACSWRPPITSNPSRHDGECTDPRHWEIDGAKLGAGLSWRANRWHTA